MCTLFLKIFLDPYRLLLKSFAGLLVECQTGNANVKVAVTMQSDCDKTFVWSLLQPTC